MLIPGITWQCERIDDESILSQLPASLATLLRGVNGFILHSGALHVRGACLEPEWHSLRSVWSGSLALHTMYDVVLATDIPFAQDQVGDQYLIRNDTVLRLSAETGEIEHMADSLESFFRAVTDDIEEYLNVGLDHVIQPGRLLLAYPPFVCESESEVRLREIPVAEVIQLHAHIATQLKGVPDGTQISFDITGT